MIYFLFFLFFTFSQAKDEDVHGFYQGKISKSANGWTIIESPMRGTGAKVYVKGDKDSEEVKIDIERSLASTNYSLMKCLNIAECFLGWCCLYPYEVEEYQLRVMLTIAAEMPYCDWKIRGTSPFTLSWLLNYDHLEMYLEYNPSKEENIREKYALKFKEKFSSCSRINLILHSMSRPLLLSEDPAMETLINTFKRQNIDIVLNHEKND